jgi:signal transduction histidine kinase
MGRQPRQARPVRVRFTILYAALFLASGIGLLGLTNLLAERQVSAPAEYPSAQLTDLAAAQGLVQGLRAQLAEIEETQSRQLLTGSAIALVVMAVVSLVLGKVVAGRVLRPLRSITAATRRISADNLHERLAVSGPADEVKHLADTIDDLLGRLEAAFAAQRRFVANASHELRTPLATMRASMDVAVAKPAPSAQTVALADRFRTELDQVDRLLEGFLVLARAQHGVVAENATVSLRDLASEAVAARAADIAGKNLTLDEDLHDGASTQGSRTLLARMVENVIDNAIVHNQDGGWIRVATKREHGSVEFAVETGGAVLDQEPVDRLAQPFQRLVADRTGSDGGTGLGLSIVAAVTDAHGGRLRLHARPEGGLRVVISLPSRVPA